MSIKFDMKVNQNHASFYDEETKDFVVVDSPDNIRFNVQVVDKHMRPQAVGSFIARTDEQLNKRLFNMAAPWMQRLPEVELEGKVRNILSKLTYEAINITMHNLEDFVMRGGVKPYEEADLYRLAHVKAGLEYLRSRQSEVILKMIAKTEEEYRQGNARPARELLAERGALRQ